MYNNYFINEINKLITEFNTKNYKLTDLQVSFAIAVILIKKYRLNNEFNELMQIYQDSKLITLDVNKD